MSGMVDVDVLLLELELSLDDDEGKDDSECQASTACLQWARTSLLISTPGRIRKKNMIDYSIIIQKKREALQL